MAALAHLLAGCQLRRQARHRARVRTSTFAMASRRLLRARLCPNRIGALMLRR